MGTPTDAGPGPLMKRTLIVMAGIGLCIIIWKLTQLLLLLFASVLTAFMFHDFARMLMRWLKLPFSAALALAVLLPLLAVLVVFGLFGSLMVDQFTALSEQLPVAVAAIRNWLGTSSTGRDIIAGIDDYAPQVETVVGFAQVALANFGTGLSGLAVVIVGGVYLAAQPHLYVDGSIAFMTKAGIGHAREIFAAVHLALIAWLKGQAIGMAFVAIGTSAGLALVGLPSAVAIGMVAGLCEFVPYLGVFLVSVPATLIGFSMGMETGIFTIIALVVVQQIQGNVVTPMAQGKFADLPPALTIFSLIGFGVLMGPLGVILAVPLTVVGMVLVRRAAASVPDADPEADTNA